MAKHPWNAIPAARSSLPVLQMKVWGILGALLLAAVLGPLAMLVALGNKGNSGAPTFPDFGAAAAARVVAEDWLAARASTIPVANGVQSFDRFADTNEEKEPLPYTALTYLGRTTPTTSFDFPHEVHSFLLTREGKEPLVLDITLWITLSGPVLATDPGLRPYVKSTTNVQALDYKNQIGDAEDGLTDPRFLDVLNKWAMAYVGGGAEGAKLLSEVVDDRALNGSYVGMGGGLKLVGQPTVLAWIPEKDVKSLGDWGIDFGSTVGYVRVRLLLSDDGSQRWITSTEYDLLVTNVGESNPRIAAWGPAGSAPLKPFSNRTPAP